MPAALNKSSVATQSAVAAAAKSLVSQHSRIKTAIKQEAVSYDVKYEYTTLLNGMSTDVKFGDLEKLANTSRRSIWPTITTSLSSCPAWIRPTT